MAFPRPHALGDGNGGNGADGARADYVADNPYGGPLAAPSNPAWRYCPEAARTPSPKPKYWPPQKLSWPPQSRMDGFSPTAPVISRLPMKDFLEHQAAAKAAKGMPALPEVPKMPLGLRTPSPRHRMNSPPSPSPRSSDVSGKSEVSLGKSGYKYSEKGHKDASLPAQILVTPPTSSSTGSMDTTLPLTPDVIEKYAVNRRGQKRRSDQSPSPTDHASSKAPLQQPLVHTSVAASAALACGSSPLAEPSVNVKCEVNVSIGQHPKSRRMI